MAATGIRKNGDVVYRELASGEGGVLLHLGTGLYYGVNRLGAAIWSLLDGERTGEGVITVLRARLGDPPTTFEADVESFLHGMRQRDLIR